ncbi:hypothetical protein J2S17_001095 [Cytobacillus purgationiresistens]|uniref:Uncharacterized protein n=1 Tax=Cytobacillus purgationiresistens TaxID=863449 RepID=A0ABU0AGL1_9BACI|nr:hypothetical protein [Cytobacillus purgationiresistens]
MKEKTAEEKAIECMLENLIKMLGKSNQHMDELRLRVNQLEMCIRESEEIA